MSMTKEEAITSLEKLVALFYTESEQSKMVDYSKIIETLEFAAAALRPITREQVEKVWRGEWEGVPRLGVYYMACSKCGFCPGMIFYSSDFCPNCGAPMTDKAVDMVMERLEEVQNDQ